MKGFRIILLVVSAVLLIASLVLAIGLLSDSPLILYPNKLFTHGGIWYYNSPGVEIDSFTGNAGGMFISYHLEEIQDFVGLGMNLPRENQAFDCSGYHFMRIDLETESTQLNFTLKTFEPGITNEEMARSFRHQQIVVVGDPFPQTVIIPLKDLKDPSWWVDEYDSHKKISSRVDLRDCRFLLIEDNSSRIGRGSLQIKGISFSRYHGVGFLFFLCLLFGLSGLSGFAFILIRKQRFKTLREIELNQGHTIAVPPSYSQAQKTKILGYMAANFKNPDLTLDKIARELGVSGKTLSRHIKEESGLSFKGYLNQLRVNEAEILLIQSDLPITEIAFQLGYNDRSYFYKIFLKLKGCSPSEFRNKGGL